MAKILPFWIYPAHWGLKGQARELALIDFNYTGLEAALKRADILYPLQLERELAKNEIRFNHGEFDKYTFEINKLHIELELSQLSSHDFKERELELKFKYNVIDEKTYDQEKVELIIDEDEKYFAALDYALKYDEITSIEHEKEKNTYLKTPWFNFDIKYNEDTSSIELTFDYNEYFWKKLRDEGHPGNNEYEIIDNFIKDWGRKLATEDYDGDYDTKLVKLNEEAKQAGIIEPGYKFYE